MHTSCNKARNRPVNCGKGVTSSIFFLLVMSLFHSVMYAQTKNKLDPTQLDSIRISHHKFINNVFQQAVNSITKTPEDEFPDVNANGKSVKPYLKYEGKIIRHIKIESLNFEKTFTDTGKRTIATRIGDAAHTNTRAYIVRNNLFIKENTVLDPYKLADNERYLRTLDYINDARIIVLPVRHSKDSVDIKVITKDFFSLSADGSSDVLNHIHMRVVNANIGGTGQRAEISGLYDHNRSPNFGYGLLYRNNSIGPTFINMTAVYSQININYDTHEEEEITGIDFERPLVSPYSHFAGGLLLSKNTASNVYDIADSMFYKYSYNLFDGWVGYNIGVSNDFHRDDASRKRKFFAARYFNYNYTDVPAQVNDNFNPVFNSRHGILLQTTFFKQEYYRTQYIYGFGTTEDMPYGYSVGLVGGWVKQLEIERPYGGININKYIATDDGAFVQLFGKTGAYYYNGGLQDASILLGGTAFSKIYFKGQTKIRQFVGFNYTQLFNRVTYAPLRINTPYGVRGFTSDSALGDKRLTIQTETEFYLKYKLLGFKFAPFIYADASLLAPENQSLSKGILYPSLGGGVRTRNENLVFETIELRCYYYPRTIDGMKGFKVVLSSNIKFRYNSNYVQKPDLVQLNTDQ